MSKSKMSRSEKRERRLANQDAVLKTKSNKYSNQYQTQKWGCVKLAVFRRDNYTCINCKSSSNLHCHHKMYVKGRFVWDYDLSIFETLCEKCHENFHKEKKGSDLVVSEWTYNNFVIQNKQGKADFKQLSIKTPVGRKKVTAGTGKKVKKDSKKTILLKKKTSEMTDEEKVVLKKRYNIIKLG